MGAPMRMAYADPPAEDAAGFRVVPIPDDNTRAEAAWRALSADLTQVLHAWTVVNNRELPDLVADVVSVVHGWAAAYLDGAPQDRPDRCPTCGSDDPAVIGRTRNLYGQPIPCARAWHDERHVGGSGDTR